MTSTPTMPADAAKLVRRYYTYAGIYTLAASIIWGINTLFLLDAGLSIAEVFIANAAFSLGTVLFEIPTGVVADTIGRRASFLLSLVVLAVSTFAYVGLAQIGAGVIAFSVASIFIGLGFTFYSGAMEAWLVDGVQGLGYEGAMDGIFANAQIIGGVACSLEPSVAACSGRSILLSHHRAHRPAPRAPRPRHSSACMTSASSRERSHGRRSPRRQMPWAQQEYATGGAPARSG